MMQPKANYRSPSLWRRLDLSQQLKSDQDRLLEEAPKITFICVMAAVVYGIVHDQFTPRICLEYFTIFHPPIFHT